MQETDPDASFEMPREVRLVRETGRVDDIGIRFTGEQHLLRTTDSDLREIGMDGNAAPFGEYAAVIWGGGAGQLGDFVKQ